MPEGFIRAAAVSVPVHLGDVEANEREILSVFHILEEKGVQLALFPSLCLTGATLGDLLARRDYQRRAWDALERIAEETDGMAVVLGLPMEKDGCTVQSAAVLQGGCIRAVAAQGEKLVFRLED